MLRNGRRGPAPKIHTTLSLKPNGCSSNRIPQPAFDMRPVIAGCPLLADRNRRWMCGTTPCRFAPAPQRFRLRAGSRNQRRRYFLHASAQIDYRHVARHIVHHVRRLSEALTTMPRGFLPVGISSTRVVSVGIALHCRCPSRCIDFHFTTILLAALITYPSSARC